MEQKPDAYSPDNLLRYHMALSFVDQLEAEGFLASGDKAAMYALIAEKYGIEKSSILPYKTCYSGRLEDIYSTPSLIQRRQTWTE